MTTIVQSTLVATTCPECGCLFGLSDDHMLSLRKTKSRFFCPNGHGQSYSISEADGLRQELARTNQRLDQIKADRDHERESRKATERRLVAAKGQQTKLKRRIEAGVCPCCTRTFQNLAQHIHQEHPDFLAEPEEESASQK